ncbi:MAG: LysR substrate-binding domain-containing protein [Kofleriaceae bacterium]
MDRFFALRTFIAVAEEAGFAAAARRLRTSPPSVTRAVSALEERVGARLLARTTRVVRVTEAGERFLSDARRILAELEEAEATAAGSHRGLRGGLRVTASVMFGGLFVAPVVAEFLAQHAELHARVLFADRVVDLAEEGFDVAVRIARLRDSSSQAVHCGAVRTVVCASPAYLRARGHVRHPKDLAEDELLGFHAALEDPRWTFFDRGKAITIAPRFRLITNSAEVGIAAALAGRGVVRSLSYMVAAPLRSGALKLLLTAYEPPPTPVHLVLPEGRQAPARVRAFVSFAAERLRTVLGPQGPAAIPEADAPRRARAPRAGRGPRDDAARRTSTRARRSRNVEG